MEQSAHRSHGLRWFILAKKRRFICTNISSLSSARLSICPMNGGALYAHLESSFRDRGGNSRSEGISIPLYGKRCFSALPVQSTSAAESASTSAACQQGVCGTSARTQTLIFYQKYTSVFSRLWYQQPNNRIKTKLILPTLDHAWYLCRIKM